MVADVVSQVQHPLGHGEVMPDIFLMLILPMPDVEQHHNSGQQNQETNVHGLDWQGVGGTIALPFFVQIRILFATR